MFQVVVFKTMYYAMIKSRFTPVLCKVDGHMGTLHVRATEGSGGFCNHQGCGGWGQQAGHRIGRTASHALLPTAVSSKFQIVHERNVSNDKKQLQAYLQLLCGEPWVPLLFLCNC